MLRDNFKKVMEDYGEVYKHVVTKNDFKNDFRLYVSEVIPNEIEKLKFFNPSIHKTVGSYGKGRWSLVPWIALFDTRITTSAQDGVYIVYLLNKEEKELYLTLVQGVADTTNQNKSISISRKPNKRQLRQLKAASEDIRTRLGDTGLTFQDEIDSGDESYDSGCIYYKKYTLATLPSEEDFIADLKKYIDVYKQYYFVYYGEKTKPIGTGEPSKPQVVKDPLEPPKSNKDILEDVKEYIAVKGFSYKDEVIENFYLCLKSKPFIILAGISGTGKTRLVKLFAEAIGANTENGRYKMIPVRPDWSDSSDLLGHVDLNSNFVKGAMTDFIVKAMEDKEHPYFLCLDEMNLARVEYYFSDMLSIIETRDSRDGEIKSDSIYLEKFRDIYLPENLYVIGTVNMDETTFPFSKKVLDRANTIEFSYVDLMPKRRITKDVTSKINVVSNSFTKARYIFLQECLEEDENFVEENCEILQEINAYLQPANLHFGYRVRDEIIFYLLNNLKEDLLPEDRAMDNEIMQKILPRISGSSAAIKKVLCELFEYCAGDYNAFGSEADEISDKMLKLLNDGEGNIMYPNTAFKLMSMMRRYEEDGFTSYWL